MYSKNEDITREDQEIMNAFFALKEEEKYHEAFKLLFPLSKKYKENFKIFFLLGLVLYQENNFKVAKNYLRRAILLNPEHYLSSLILFHSLSHLSEWHTAFHEMRRFLLTKAEEKKEHLMLLKEIYEGIDNFSTSHRKSIENLWEEFLK